MSKTPQRKWQWMDNHFGAMGWFSDKEKRKHEREGKPEFSNGHFREIPPEEVAAMDASIARLAYEQS